jgi:hypothetical protein
MAKDTKVTLFKGGTREVTIPVSEVAIPDLWHITQALRDGSVSSLNSKQCENACEMILDCWHIAGALKVHIEKS